MLHHAAAVIVLSKHTQDTLVTRNMTSSETCHLVYNGIADPLHGQIQHDTWERPIAITFLGSISAAKGVPVLVSAVARMRKQLPAFRVILGGLGDVNGLLDAIAREKVASLMSYVGWLGEEEKAIVLAKTDIFVLPSRSEGFPVAIIEAMAYGIAIVSTAIPGVMDAIRNEIDGLLILPDDEAALAESLERLVLNASERRRLGASARQRFLDSFTIDIIVSQLVDIYKAVKLGRPTPATGKPWNKRNR
jgi:glycosyltransferase involved in cell wall biosynthesis